MNAYEYRPMTKEYAKILELREAKEIRDMKLGKSKHEMHTPAWYGWVPISFWIGYTVVVYILH